MVNDGKIKVYSASNKQTDSPKERVPMISQPRVQGIPRYVHVETNNWFLIPSKSDEYSSKQIADCRLSKKHTEQASAKTKQIRRRKKKKEGQKKTDTMGYISPADLLY